MSIAAQPSPPLTRDEALKLVQNGATLVTGNDRLARVLRSVFHEQRRAAGEAAWASPHIHSWSVWVDRLWRDWVYRAPEALPVRLTSDQERMLWERAIEQDGEANRLLSIEAAADTARQAWRLMIAWRAPRTTLEATEIDDVRAFARWSAAFEAICRDEGFTDGARAVDLLLASRAMAGEAPVLLAGFDVYTPQQRELLGAFRDAGVTVREVVPASQSSRESRRVACESRREEVRAAARWAKRLAAERPEARIAVVLPHLADRRQEVERIFREAFDAPALLLGSPAGEQSFAISAGLPLDRYPLVHGALAALEMHPGGMPFAAFAAWLRCDGVAGGEAERSARGLLDRRLREKGVSTVTMRGLAPLLKDAPLLSKAVRRWGRRFRDIPETQSPAAWTDTFSSLLRALGWPGGARLDSEEFQVVEKWNELLCAFASLGATAGAMDSLEARRILRRMAAETPFQPATRQTQIEVMDLFESAGAEADFLWVAGLDDETWPAPARPNPFLPLALQRQLGMPHASAEEELAFARVETKRLLTSAPVVVVSHAAAVEDREIGPSPLILEIPPAELDAVAPAPESGVIQAMYASKSMETLADHAAPAFTPDEPAVGGTRIFEFQAHCPFRAFAQLRLGAQPLRAAEPGLAAWERGLLVHDAMEHVWRRLEGSDALHRSADEELAHVIREGVGHAIETLTEKRREPLPTRFEQVERGRLQELIFAWLQVEKADRRDGFRAIEFEFKRTVEIRGVKAEVRIDRVDQLQDGRQIILDYKTGATKSKEWDHARPIEPQLPLYAVSHDEALGGALFARLRAMDSGFQGAVAPGVSIRGSEERRADRFDERIAQWRRNLEALADEFLGGRAVVEPRDGKCRYCELPALCRKDDAA